MDGYMSPITLPAFFENVSSANVVELGNVSSVLYNQSSSQDRVSVCITKSMFAIVIKGRKIIHTEKGDIEIASGDMFFAERGAYLLSERMNVDGEYRSLIFFIDDSYLQDFTARNPDLARKQNCLSTDNAGIYTVAVSQLLNNWIQSVIPVFFSQYVNRRELLRYLACHPNSGSMTNDWNGRIIF
jgi:hypothetical protein